MLKEKETRLLLSVSLFQLIIIFLKSDLLGGGGGGRRDRNGEHM